MSQALRSVGMTVTDEIREILTALDADGDGRISFQEFNDFWNQNVREGHDVEGSAPKAWVSAGESLDALDFDTTKMLDELVPLHTVSVSTSLRRG